MSTNLSKTCRKFIRGFVWSAFSAKMCVNFSFIDYIDFCIFLFNDYSFLFSFCDISLHHVCFLFQTRLFYSTFIQCVLTLLRQIVFSIFPLFFICLNFSVVHFASVFLFTVQTAVAHCKKAPKSTWKLS